MEPIIEVRRVSKKYSRNENAHLGYGVRDLLDELLGRKRSLKLRKDEFLAVNDVSFSLDPGETYALLGRNGSGKTTLLKMMNGLIKPDAGSITLRGSVQALINVGAGFNPNLSGRDNIYNSASLMGMTRRETAAIMDDIVDFAELEEFIESPFQTYSSGMKARLGFAVAVCLKPDILLIDEILAVGDVAFQNKCFKRMEELKSAGVTIVFVSHAQAEVIKLCRNAMWLHGGKVMHVGPSLQTMKAYLHFLEEQEKAKLIARNEAGQQKAKHRKTSARESIYGPVYPELDHVDEVRCTLLVNGKETDVFPLHSAVTIRVVFRLKQHVANLFSTLCFHRKDGLLVATIASMRDGRLKDIHEGRVTYEVRIPDFDLVAGPYVIMMPIAEGQSYLWRNIVKEFYVEGDGQVGRGIKEFRHDFTIKVELPANVGTPDGGET